MTQGSFDGSSEDQSLPGPRADAQAAVDADDSARFTTAARALVLGNSLASPNALAGLDDEVAALGFSGLPDRWGGWKDRIEALDQSDALLNQVGLLASVQDREVSRAVPSGQGPSRQARVQLWELASGVEATPPAAIAWLRAVMTDDEPLAATAAASALSGWRRTAAFEVPVALEAARDIVLAMEEGADEDARAISQATTGAANDALSVPQSNPVGQSNLVGTIVHGTFAYPESWWYVGGDFHTFVANEVCSHIYSGGQAFSWSGAYKGRHRAVAAQRFADWASQASMNELCCVFAHSYGAAVALNATAYGAKINTAILLSAPVENIPIEWRNIGRTVSLRIHADLVLLAARRRQFFTENVEEYYLPRWFRAHGDTHSPNVWHAQNSATTLALPAH